MDWKKTYLCSHDNGTPFYLTKRLDFRFVWIILITLSKVCISTLSYLHCESDSAAEMLTLLLCMSHKLLSPCHTESQHTVCLTKKNKRTVSDISDSDGSAWYRLRNSHWCSKNIFIKRQNLICRNAKKLLFWPDSCGVCID